MGRRLEAQVAHHQSLFMSSLQTKDDVTYDGLTSRLINQPITSAVTVAADAATKEGTPAYRAIESLLTSEYRISGAESIRAEQPNSSRLANLALCWFRPCGMHTFDVPRGKIRLAEDGSGNYEIYGPGVHRVQNMFMRVWDDVSLTQEVIVHGDRTVVTVKQGCVGYCEDMGQPILLPPGLHEWQSQTLKYKESVDLNNSLIRLGPYTVITVDEGYCAVTQNNGRQMVLQGGETHLLNHRNWKFEKFMTQKIQTNDLQRIEATSADNVMMHTDATVVWRITNVDDAAKWSAETMNKDGKETNCSSQTDIKKLRNDVLKQATASLAAFIGEIRYSDSFHISAAGPSTATGQVVGSTPRSAGTEVTCSMSAIFDGSRMASAVEAANAITSTYGVTILSINIISAVPADHDLQQALARGAVASADAERAETVARGEAKAVRIRAEADAEAEKIRAEGARSAADLLATSAVAVDLAKIGKTGEALQGKGTNTLFFGADNGNLGGLLANPTVVNGGGIKAR